MKKISLILLSTVMAAGLLSSCKKTETTTVSTPPFQIGQPITPGNLSSGSYKGTMTSGNTYTLTGDFTINKGDTVLLQSNVKVCVQPGVTIIVKGSLISLGTSSQPNWFTACGATKVDVPGENPTNDPAWNLTPGTSVLWTGINCDTSCRLLDIRWTHIEFCGAAFATTEPFVGGASGSNSFAILFQQPEGDCILTDSWIYGTDDDAFRIQQGRLYVARNTFEKMGYLGGDGINAKHGSQGDMAFNLCIGNATNSTKASDKGSGPFVECNINMYNNTYVDCGYRQASYASRGSDIDIEQGARGLIYNNLIVNCRNGIRVGDNQNGIPQPDTANVHIGNNYYYADSIQEISQGFPVQAGTWTKISAYSIPANIATAWNLPTPFYNPPYDDSAYIPLAAAATANNPKFANFPLPQTAVSGYGLGSLNSVATGVNDAHAGNKAYDFHLQAGSPAIGAGNTSFSPFQNVTNPVTADVKNSNFAAIVSAPGVDIGCYQSNGSGNTH